VPKKNAERFNIDVKALFKKKVSLVNPNPRFLGTVLPSDFDQSPYLTPGKVTVAKLKNQADNRISFDKSIWEIGVSNRFLRGTKIYLKSIGLWHDIHRCLGLYGAMKNTAIRKGVYQNLTSRPLREEKWSVKKLNGNFQNSDKFIAVLQGFGLEELAHGACKALGTTLA
jgi:hypothetical protein